MDERQIRTFSKLLVLLALFFSNAGPARAESPDDILIIAHKNVSKDSISSADLRDYFLKKKTTWAPGERVVPIHAPRGSSLRREFVERALKMALEEERIYWEKRKIQAGETEPVSFSQNLKAVFKLKGAVSYIYRRDFRAGVVKVLMVLPAK